MTIREEIERLVSLLQALTLQKLEAQRNGKQREVLQIQSVQTDIDNKIQELEVLVHVEKGVSDFHPAL